MISTINIFTNHYLTRKPDVNFTFLKEQNQFAGYWHNKRAMGGDWACGFEVFGTENELLELFENGLYQLIESFNGEGILAWEGFIAGMELDTPAGTLKKDLSDMYNDAACTYTTTMADYPETVQEQDGNQIVRMAGNLNSGASITLRELTSESFARYGGKQINLNVGSVPSLGVAEQIRDYYLVARGMPNLNPSLRLTKNRVEQKLRLRVRCEGRIKSQSWVLYEQSVLPTTQTQTVSDKVAAVTYNSRILPNEVIESNSTLVFERDLTNRRRLDILFDLCRLSDSSYNRYIIYSKGDTIFYEQAASNDKSNLRYYPGEKPVDILQKK